MLQRFYLVDYWWQVDVDWPREIGILSGGALPPLPSVRSYEYSLGSGGRQYSRPPGFDALILLGY